MSRFNEKTMQRRKIKLLKKIARADCLMRTFLHYNIVQSHLCILNTDITKTIAEDILHLINRLIEMSGTREKPLTYADLIRSKDKESESCNLAIKHEKLFNELVEECVMAYDMDRAKIYALMKVLYADPALAIKLPKYYNFCICCMSVTAYIRQQINKYQLMDSFFYEDRLGPQEFCYREFLDMTNDLLNQYEGNEKNKPA